MRFLFPACLLLSWLSACQPAAESARLPTGPDVLTVADFEQSIGWGGADATALTTDEAHSGRWSVRAQPDVPFSFTYLRRLGELSATPMRELLLEAWALRPAAGSTARLVVQVDASATDATKVFYLAYPLEMAVPTLGEWTAVRVPLTLPAAANSASQLKIYLWNDHGTAPTYLDDVVLRRVTR